MTYNKEKNQSVERNLEKKTQVVGISRQGCSNSYYKDKGKHEFETKWKIYFLKPTWNVSGWEQQYLKMKFKKWVDLRTD